MRDTSPGWDQGVSVLQMYVFVNCHYLPVAWKAPLPVNQSLHVMQWIPVFCCCAHTWIILLS